MLTIMRMFKSSRGFSMPELMIAVAISGVVAIGASKMMSDSYQKQAYIETLSDISKVMALAQGNLANKAHCVANMKQFTSATVFPAYTPGGAHVGPSITGLVQSGVTGKMLVKVGDYGKFTLDEIRVTQNATATQVKDFNFFFTWKGRPLLSTAEIVKTVSVFTEVDPAVGTYSCSGIVRDSQASSEEALCTSLGAEFASWDGTRCNINPFTCPYGQVAYMITSLGKVVCKATESTLDINALTETTLVACPASSPNIHVEFTGGKFRLVCGTGVCSPTYRNWGAWSAWGACSGTTQTRTRTCSGAVSCGGTDNCTGSNTETQACFCVTNGNKCSSNNICGDNDCSDCCNAPLATCPVGTGTQAICGGTLSCTGGGNCL